MELFSRISLVLAAGVLSFAPAATGETPLIPPLAEVAKAALAAFNRGDYAAAEKGFQRLHEELPISVFALANLGVAQLRLGRLKEAAGSLEQAIALAPDDAFSWHALGFVYFAQARADDAERAFKKDVELNPKCAVAHRFLGMYAAKSGQTAVAQNENALAETLDPSPEPPPGLGDFLTPAERKRLGY